MISDTKLDKPDTKTHTKTSSRFGLTLLLETGRNNSHYRMLKIIAPTLTVTGPKDCPITNLVERFFREQPNVEVVRRCNSYNKSPVVEVDVKHHTYIVPLPKLDDGAAEKTLHTRLTRQFNKRKQALREHQSDLLKELKQRDFNVRNTPAFTIFWEMGSGKTLGSLYLVCERRSANNVIICGNTNIEYWADVLRTVEPDVRQGERHTVLSFDIVGYTAFRADYDDEHAMKSVSTIIVDEAHYFRNNTQGMQFAMQCVRSAKNVLLLTGTPIVNDIEDVTGMMELIDMDNVFCNVKDAVVPPTPKQVESLLKNHVSWFDPSTHRPNMYKRYYPVVHDETVKVPMNIEQTLEYLMAVQSNFHIGPFIVQQGKSNRYNTLTRAACNAPKDHPETSPKLQAVVDMIKQYHERGPITVHSSLVETGVKPLYNMLGKQCPNLKREMITGETPNSKRNSIRCRYNQGKINVLFISDASQQGTDLMGTSVIILVEPFPNTSLRNQTRARVIRMGSHLKSKFKEVLCFSFVSTFPTTITPTDVQSGLAYFSKLQILGRDTDKLLKQIDFKREVEKLMKLCQNQTINEKQLITNTEKQRIIDPYLDAMRRATIKMSTQRDTKLFENTIDHMNKMEQECKKIVKKRKKPAMKKDQNQKSKKQKTQDQDGVKECKTKIPKKKPKKTQKNPCFQKKKI